MHKLQVLFLMMMSRNLPNMASVTLSASDLGSQWPWQSVSDLGILWPWQAVKPFSEYILFISRKQRKNTRDHFVHAPSQWEMTLHCNVISHWLGAYTKWSLVHIPGIILCMHLANERQCYKVTSSVIGWATMDQDAIPNIWQKITQHSQNSLLSSVGSQLKIVPFMLVYLSVLLRMLFPRLFTSRIICVWQTPEHNFCSNIMFADVIAGL